nr:uncharacterized protein CTRU02_12077 [Colletotrichum truncatum]KAF6785145.1 hypothetical protein CTRU02_12077 [Colletotrichum truncatum]
MDQDRHNDRYNDQPGLESAQDQWATAPIPQSPATQSLGMQSMATDPKWMGSQQHYAVRDDVPPPPPSEKRRVLGLTVPVFWGLVTALVIILAAGIAGGVAGGLITQKANSSSDNQDTQTSPTATVASSSASSSPSSIASGTTTATSSSASATSSVLPDGKLPAPTDGGCPGINMTTYTPTNAESKAITVNGGSAQTFRQLCEVNYASGATWGNPDIHDILKTYVSTFEQCMTLCASYNVQYADNLKNGRVSGGGWCRSVAMIKTPGEYCYLKNGTGKSNTQNHPADFVTGVVVLGLDQI